MNNIKLMGIWKILLLVKRYARNMDRIKQRHQADMVIDTVIYNASNNPC